MSNQAAGNQAARNPINARVERPPDETLYPLLPAVYRRGDRAQGEPLRALLAVLETQLARLRDELGAQYDNWFVETCEAWVLPYLGRLLGDPHALTDYDSWADPRSWVGWLQELRRWQGTPGALERAVHAITGWHVHVTEFQRQLGVLQRADSPQPARGSLADVRRQRSMRLCGGPFNDVSHLVDVRQIDDVRGRFGLRKLGLFLWRMTAEPVVDVQPSWHGQPGCFAMNPLGVDAPLFHRPTPFPPGARDPLPEHFPSPIDPRQAAESLAGIYGDEHSFSIRFQGKLVPAANVVARTLAGDASGPWKASRSVRADTTSARRADMPQFVVDVACGRLMVVDASHHDRVDAPWTPVDCAAEEIQIVCYRGVSAPLGGGYYDRRRTLIEPGSSRNADHEYLELEAVDLGSRVRAFSESDAVERRTLLRIVDSRTFVSDEPLTIRLPTVGWLVIEAADRARPCLSGTDGPLRVCIEGGSRDALLILNGLLIRGTLELIVASDAAGTLGGPLNIHLRHSTVTGGIHVRTRASTESLANVETPGLNPDDLPLGVHIENSIVGPIRLPADSLGLTVRDSIIDSRNLVGVDRAAAKFDDGLAIGGPREIDAFGPALSVHRSTILGPLRVREIRGAEDVVGTGVAAAQRLDVGYVHRCYFPPHSLGLPPDGRRPPAFHSLRFGDPRYAQLKPDNDAFLLTGASDGTELGAFGPARQAKLATELRKMLDELIPVHLRPGIFFET